MFSKCMGDNDHFFVPFFSAIFYCPFFAMHYVLIVSMSDSDSILYLFISIRLFDRCRDRSKYPSRIGGSGRIPATGDCVDSTGRMPPHPGAVRHLSEIPSLSKRSTMVNIIAPPGKLLSRNT